MCSKHQRLEHSLIQYILERVINANICKGGIWQGLSPVSFVVRTPLVFAEPVTFSLTQLTVPNVILINSKTSWVEMLKENENVKPIENITKLISSNLLTL